MTDRRKQIMENAELIKSSIGKMVDSELDNSSKMILLVGMIAKELVEANANIEIIQCDMGELRQGIHELNIDIINKD